MQIKESLGDSVIGGYSGGVYTKASNSCASSSKGKAQLTKNVSNLVQGHMPDILVLSPEKEWKWNKWKRRNSLTGNKLTRLKMSGTLQIQGQGKIGRA